MISNTYCELYPTNRCTYGKTFISYPKKPRGSDLLHRTH